MHELIFECDSEKLSTVLFPSHLHGARTAVILHGAGNATKQGIIALYADLAPRANVLAFDFSGHGASTGTLVELSLERRFHQACAVIEEFTEPGSPMILVGFSMSGQTVGDLLGEFGARVTTIGLCSPGVYAKDAWGAPFTEQFTEHIRVPNSWAASGALENFRRFTGRAVLAAPGHDEVIPLAVTDAVADALRERSALTHLVFPEARHRLGECFAHVPRARRRLLDALFASDAKPHRTAPDRPHEPPQDPAAIAVPGVRPIVRSQR